MGLEAGELLLGRYRVVKLLGRGGMGAVYRVHDQVLDEEVALKVLENASPSLIARFKRELRLGRKVTHRNVGRIYDLGEHEGHFFLTMELIEGFTVEETLRAHGPFPLERALAITAEIAQALQAAHEQGVIHRDLKPSNVVISPQGRVVVIDFSVARSVHGEEADQSQTLEGAWVGTADYMAPEQVLGVDVGAVADVYSLGLVLFEMLTNTKPFIGSTAVARATARLQQPPCDVRTLRPQTPKDVGALIADCLERTPSKRPMAAVVLARLSALRAADAATRVDVPDPLALPTQWAGPPLLNPNSKTIGIAPFSTEGDDPLGSAIADELCDLLSRTRGLRVARLQPGQKATTELILRGTVQRTGDQVRLTARLDDATGVQIWMERTGGSLGNVLALQERLARRIAEALRLELEALEYRARVPPEAIEKYLEAKHMLRRQWDADVSKALSLLDAALAIAPEFGLAAAAHAAASARAWYYAAATDDGAAFADTAPKAAARALVLAPTLPDAHVAAAMVAVEMGEYRTAIRRLERALDLAPTHAAAHELLGRLECEAGRPEQGIPRLKLAIELDRGRALAMIVVARVYAMRRRTREMEIALQVAIDRFGPQNADVIGFKAVVGVWLDEPALSRSARDSLPEGSNPAFIYADLLARFELGEDVVEPLRGLVQMMTSLPASPRFISYAWQHTAAGFARIDPAFALDALEHAVDGALLDIDWLDHCPALDGIRGGPRFTAARRRLLTRTAAIWDS